MSDEYQDIDKVRKKAKNLVSFRIKSVLSLLLILILICVIEFFLHEMIVALVIFGVSVMIMFWYRVYIADVVFYGDQYILMIFPVFKKSGENVKLTAGNITMVVTERMKKMIKLSHYCFITAEDYSRVLHESESVLDSIIII